MTQRPKLYRSARFLTPLTLAFALTHFAPALSLHAADPVNATSPTSATTDAAITAAGFSPARLQRLDTAIEDQIARHRLAGGIMYVSRDGRPVVFKTYGLQDVENRQPMRADAIFRIASMSKAITTTAVMMLYEEGRFRLSDPVSKYLPAFKDSVVAIPAPESADNPESVGRISRNRLGHHLARPPTTTRRRRFARFVIRHRSRSQAGHWR